MTTGVSFSSVFTGNMQAQMEEEETRLSVYTSFISLWVNKFQE
jgi:hypothetical protein